MIWLIFLTLLIPAMVLLLLGVRGRRVGDHPHCRRCGYDLFGREPGGKCPECGADLTAKHAMAIGQHRRRGGMLLAGAVLLLAILPGWVGVKGMHINWYHYRPTAWVLEDFRLGRDGRALAELWDRYGHNKLTPEQTSKLVDIVLAIQQNPNITWRDGYPQLLFSLRGNRSISDRQWQTYLTHVTAPTLETRSTLLAGKPLHVAFREQKPLRGGVGGVAWKFFLLAVRVDGVASDVRIPTYDVSGGDYLWVRAQSGLASGGSSGGSTYNWDLLKGLAPGTHTVEFDLRADYWSGIDQKSVVTAPPEASRTLTLKRAITLLATRPPGITGSSDWARPEAKKVTVAIYWTPQDELCVRFDTARDVPPVVASLWLRLPDGKELDMQSTTVRLPAPDGHRYLFKKDLLPKDVTAVDVILKPDPDAADDLTEDVSIWDQPLEFAKIPVKAKE